MKKIIHIIIICLLSNMGCKELVDHIYRVRIQNNSNDTIQFYESYNYPDTALDLTRPRLRIVYPSKYSFLDSKKEWEEVLIPPKDTISIFILSKDTVDKYIWDKIKSDYNILKRYDLSLDDLKKQNWTVTYP